MQLLPATSELRARPWGA
ncbi:hypothetical protein Celaphus_00002617 [Cervus elaphus hippelaphus]|uniref:Uncharacterized protein n=1 Tax=Cervus elaphus hippelaphus TaxID=46360 RepID=A0A212CFS8_CEREH|nr:hypothetical protein Celaphus_00002617 [Cervus elaphus hippelaphus]